ncbi:hypothetical protein BT96DRAFT_808828 [Gymnopus androsaceus JB14]|uniref:Uncharacterized protein n=1 Tax=Gymnopus androsaceus JB14 TaxID=1447944 RepID=A0A6A4IFJ4_9AGAR|nr:hypothetical protein BT96DRAFT_808828 [Gymnopus androsaceus JB14]
MLNEKLIAHNSKLRMRNSDLESQLKQKGARKGKSNQHDPLLNHELIVKLAKQYTVMVYPWASEDLFMTTPPDDSPEPESKDRFKSLQAFNAGLVKELHSYLKDPDLCQKAAKYAPFKKSFIYQAKQGRTAAIHTVRECLPIIFESVDAPPKVWFTDGGALRRDCPALKSLLQFPNGSPTKDPLSPIFYPNCVKNPLLLFMNDFQPKVCLPSSTKFLFLKFLPDHSSPSLQ